MISTVIESFETASWIRSGEGVGWSRGKRQASYPVNQNAGTSLICTGAEGPQGAENVALGGEDTPADVFCRPLEAVSKPQGCV
jgi:hypothetical protein